MKLSTGNIGKSKIILKLRLMFLNLYTPLSSPILVNSIPKSGTNLLRNIILSIPGTLPATYVSRAHFVDDSHKRLQFLQARMELFDSGAVYTGHIRFSPEIAQWLRDKRIKQIFIYRDPRDYAISISHFAMRFASATEDWQHMLYSNFSTYQNNSERLLASIQGIGKGIDSYCIDDTSYPNIGSYYNAYKQWISDENVLAVRYEDFIKEDGLDVDAGVETVKRILEFLELNERGKHIDPQDILLRGQEPDKSNTFRKGVSGQWREEYSEEHIAAFKAVAGNLLQELGYEDFD